MHLRSPSDPTPRRLRRVVAGGLAVAVVGALSVLAPGAPASAAPQTDAIPLGEAGTAPTGGTLPNQVAWSVNVGDWHPEQGYAAFPGDSPQVWEFDRPVSVRFGIAGLNLPGECVRVPEGTAVEVIHANHAWDADQRLVCRTGASEREDESVFTLAGPVEELVLEIVGGTGTAGRGPTFIEVTYDLPVATIAGPAEGATLELGGGEPLAFSCDDGTGEVSGSATIDGEPIAEGAAVDDLGPGTYTIEVTCTDEHGASHTTAVTFEVVDTTPPAVTIDGPADDAEVPYGSPLTADFSCADLDLATCTAVDGDGNPIEPGQALDTTTPGTYTITVTAVDGSGNLTTVTHTYTVLPPACVEDGLQVLDPPHSNYFDLVNVEHEPTAASELVHGAVESLLAAVVDPVTSLLGLPVSPLVHQANCSLVVPVEDVVDSITIPVVVEVKQTVGKLLGRLFG